MKALLTRSASGGVKRLRRALSTEGSQGTLGAATWRGVPRFYQHCGAAPHPSGEGWQVLIEGRPLRSNAAAELTLPSQGLALAIAGEFASQGAMIVPATTALYNLASTAADTFASEDPAGTADYEAYLRATRLSTFDMLEARHEALAEAAAPGGAGAARDSVAAIVASARALEGQVPGHASLESGRSGSGAMTSGAGSGTSRLRDLMLDSLETDSVCYRVDWDTGDPAERLLRKRQDRCVWQQRRSGARVRAAGGRGAGPPPPPHTTLPFSPPPFLPSPPLPLPSNLPRQVLRAAAGVVLHHLRLQPGHSGGLC